jgi:hypothetical protein
MVFCSKCSLTNLCTSSISSCISSSSCPGSVVGAPGSSLIAWSHMVWPGSYCDSFSLNTFKCHSYSVGTPFISSLVTLLMVTFPKKYWSLCTDHGTLTCCGKYIALAKFSVWNIMGSWLLSIQPFFSQSLVA